MLADEGQWRQEVGKAVDKWSEDKWRTSVLDNGVLKRTYTQLRVTRGRTAAGYLSHNADPIDRKWWTRLRSGLAICECMWANFPGYHGPPECVCTAAIGKGN